MIYKVRPYRILEMPGGVVWARPGDCVELEPKESWEVIAARKVLDECPEHKGTTVHRPVIEADVAEKATRKMPKAAKKTTEIS